MKREVAAPSSFSSPKFDLHAGGDATALRQTRAGVSGLTVDWPGFGDLARPRADWSPEAMSTFLNWLLNEVVPPPHAIIAAGHAATYALYEAANRPGTIDRLVLIAPTWHGPLPTMMAGQRSWFARIRAVVDNPVIGPLVYRPVGVLLMPQSRPAISAVFDHHRLPRSAHLNAEPSREGLPDFQRGQDRR